MSALLTRRSLLLAAPAIILTGRVLAQIGPIPGAAVLPPYKEYLGGAWASANGASNTWSFTMSSFGTAAAGRYVMAIFGYGASSTITTVTIGGISATQVLATANSTEKISYWIAPVPTNGSLAIVSNGSGSGTVTCSVYAIFGTTFPTSPLTYTGTSAISQTQNVATGSFIIAAGLSLSSSSSFTGLTSDNTETVSLIALTVGSKVFGAGQNGYTFGVTVAGGSSPACAAAVWI